MDGWSAMATDAGGRISDKPGVTYTGDIRLTAVSASGEASGSGEAGF